MNTIKVLKSILLTTICMMTLTACQNQDKAEAPRKITTDNLKGVRIAIGSGSVQDVYITRTHPEATIVRLPSTPEMIQALEAGQCDVFMMNQLITDKLIRDQHPNIECVQRDVVGEDIGYGFSPDSVGLRQAFNTYLSEIKKDGTFNDMYRRWIDDQQEVMPKGLIIPTQGQPLRIGILVGGAPFCFLKNNELIGFDVEMITRFAIKMNRPIEFVKFNFSGLLASVNSGRADMIACSIAITEERKKSIAFCDSYMKSYSGLYGLKSDVVVPHKSFWEKTKESFVNNLVVEDRWKLIVEGLWLTLIISVGAAFVGTILGGVICWMRMNKKKGLRGFAKGYITLMRSLPILVLLMLMYYVFFASWDVSAVVIAIIAFSMNFGAHTSEVFRTSIESVDAGQTEAGVAMGFTPWQTFRFIVLPQAIKRALPTYKGFLISLVLSTSVVGYIGVEDLTKMSDVIRSRTYDAFFPLLLVAFIYFVLTFVLTKGIGRIGKEKVQSTTDDEDNDE